ncbi:MAG TPA: hypothetical protein VM123_14810 [archaeon]|nr:hypothetical protein [archaeon]
MPVTEVPNSGYAYRVQPLDKDQASQNEYQRREKKKKSDEKGKKQEDSLDKSAGRKDGSSRINLIV